MVKGLARFRAWRQPSEHSFSFAIHRMNASGTHFPLKFLPNHRIHPSRHSFSFRIPRSLATHTGSQTSVQFSAPARPRASGQPSGHSFSPGTHRMNASGIHLPLEFLAIHPNHPSRHPFSFRIPRILVTHTGSETNGQRSGLARSRARCQPSEHSFSYGIHRMNASGFLRGELRREFTVCQKTAQAVC